MAVQTQWTGKFQAAKALAANVSQTGEQGSYTEAMFQEDFPQFTRKVMITEEGEEPEVQNLLPAGILNMFLDQVNDSVLPSRWGSMWRYAAGLYLAHFAAMYLKTYSQDLPVHPRQLPKRSLQALSSRLQWVIQRSAMIIRR